MVNIKQRSSTVLEREIQAKMLSYLKEVGAFCFKTIACNKRGIPDICAVYKGVPLFIEVKRDKYGKVSELQKYQIEQIKKAGGQAFVCFSVEDLREIVYNIDNNTKKE